MSLLTVAQWPTLVVLAVMHLNQQCGKGACTAQLSNSVPNGTSQGRCCIVKWRDRSCQNETQRASIKPELQLSLAAAPGPAAASADGESARH
mmetsp:Transcript_8101/g.14144  ORF Transcript_8101/g.14144 Transcript_8101/m.14144 type:complete len:92 (+) Transcript_8101:194-469(+)